MTSEELYVLYAKALDVPTYRSPPAPTNVFYELCVLNRADVLVGMFEAVFAYIDNDPHKTLVLAKVNEIQDFVEIADTLGVP